MQKSSKEQLILEYAPLVRYCAQNIYNKLPKTVEFDDLISYGSFGLLDALEKYNPEISDNFQAYAILRIRGAIIDGLRKMDWASQSLRRKAKKIESAFHVLNQKYGRQATYEEVANYLKIKTTELSKYLTQIDSLSLTSLEQTFENEDDSLTLKDIIIDTNSVDPLKKIELEELKDALVKAIKELNEKERLVITLLYYEELTVKEISKILELSEGRISQIHKKAVSKLKVKLGKF